MKRDKLLLVFAKNPVPGKVKTRLAREIGDTLALDVYKYLLNSTENACTHLNNTARYLYFSDYLEHKTWRGANQFIQNGNNLGERMSNAFKKGFSDGYNRIVCIGTDLPDFSADLIDEAMEKLQKNDLVFGPATDGGYYLIGMKELHPYVFENKDWSTSSVLHTTLMELKEKRKTVGFLRELSDIDNLEDLRNSSLYPAFANRIDQK